MQRLLIGNPNILVLDDRFKRIRYGFNVLVLDKRMLTIERNGLTEYSILTTPTQIKLGDYNFEVKGKWFETKKFRDLTDIEIAANVTGRTYAALQQELRNRRPDFTRTDEVVLIGFDLCMDKISTMNGVLSSVI